MLSSNIGSIASRSRADGGLTRASAGAGAAPPRAQAGVTASPVDSVRRSQEATAAPESASDSAGALLDGIKGWKSLPGRGPDEGQSTPPSSSQPPSPADRFKSARADFGKAIDALPPDQKKQVGEIQDQVRKKSEEARKTGMPYDPTEMFPMQVVGWADEGREKAPGDRGLEKVSQAGGQYVDSYRSYILSQDRELDLKP